MLLILLQELLGKVWSILAKFLNQANSKNMITNQL